MNKGDPHNGTLNYSSGPNSAEKYSEGAENKIEKIVYKEPQEDCTNMYLVRWYAYEEEDYNLEPIEQFPRIKVVHNYLLKSLKKPLN